ncbi:DUF6804 family protein [Winogradskyella haliclonae]|uniref:Uncharacterized protein n=1 Tax=Winogradskyella haliclonae TaxID=2048558 RepID=A0ABQ2BWZ8_9FLAO|nr:DUF6804 family protein [Winogradskyella haliclonae]GGI56976.1 hypothetical protein GCM10011444_12850 [Winogradskyella haliclonae]
MKSNNLLKSTCVCCAILLFVAVFYWPIEYYTFLRTIVFIGALLVMVSLRQKQFPWILAFVIIAILFNPIFPIYLYIKAYWIPIDIISGILFLLVAFLKQPQKKSEKKVKKADKTYSRDKIY